VGKESIDVIVKHIREKPPELRALVPDVPLEVHSIVMKCLEKAPEARFQNMDELLEAMQIATTGQGISGIFADPRTLSSSQVPRAKTGGVEAQSATPSGTRLPVPPPPERELAGEDSIPVDLSFSYPGTVAPPPARGRMIGGLVALIVAGVSIGGFIAFQTRPARPVPLPTPLAQPAPPLEVSPPAAEVARPARVVFEVSSEPPGARVTRDGAPVGTTPLSLTVERSGAEAARVELLLSLEGYADAKVLAQGSAGRVPVSQVLQKRELPAPQAARPVPPPARRRPGPPPPARTDNPPGYKDDPYQ
jgi:serine/threonine-protein kinase